MAELVSGWAEPVRCPVCGSARTRSKIHDEHGWWYICDNVEDPHEIENEDGEGRVEVLRLRERAVLNNTRMFYWNPEVRRIDIPGYGTGPYGAR